MIKKMGSTSKQVVILGCGDIGQRVARLASGKGWNVTGVRRSAPQADHTISMIQGDASDHAFLISLLETAPDVILISVTPDHRSDDGYLHTYINTCRAVNHAVKAAKVTTRVIFVSSTAVYGQKEGEWVDETSVTQPNAFNGIRLLEAEEWIVTLPNSVCVRASGIYGPSRERLIRALQDNKIPPGNDISNRIHADDLARALFHLMQLPAPEKHYIATDEAPTPIHDVLQWLAEALNMSLAVPQDARMGNKRLSNRRLVNTGFTFIYSSFKEGYRHILTNRP